MSRSARPSTLRTARVCSGLLLLVLLALALVPAPAAATQVAAAPLTSNLAEDQFPEVSAGQVAWLQGVGSDSEVRLFDGSSTVLVTDNGWMLDVDAHLSAGRLVWKNSVDFLSCSIERWSGGNQATVDASIPCASEIRAAGPHTIWTESGTGGLDVFLRTDAGAPVQLGADNVSESSPRVGDVAGAPRAAWLAPGGALWYWNGSDAPGEIVPSGASAPEMDGARVVWVASDGNDDEIFVYDGVSVTPLTNNTYDDAEPRISGGYVAWTGYPDTLAEGEIFVADGVATLQLTDDDLDDRSPRVSTGLAGPTVAWIKDYGGENNVGDEIWMYEGCAAARVTDNAVADTGPSLDGHLLAWVRGGGSESEIWAATVTCEGASAPACGDGAVDAGEQCDDGGNAPGDGCDESCVDEICGNGVLQSGAGEACDDGNTADGDGCSAGCLVECGDGDVDAGEECDDSNASSGDGCSATCLAEMCGNGRIDAGEECDDGNSAEGDACGSSCGAPEAASEAHQKCINAMNQLGARLTATHHKVALQCLHDAAPGHGAQASAEDCLSNDSHRRIAKAEARTTSCGALRCDAEDPPDFAYTGAAAVNGAAEAEAMGLLADLFGPDLDAALMSKAAHGARARCQQKVLKAADDLSGLLFKLAVHQKKKLLAGADGAVVASNEALELGLLGYVQEDARGWIGRKAAKLAGTAAKACRRVDLDAAFPGCAPSADPAAVASCATSAARCRFCRALNAFDGLAMDCDDLDDGAGNASCP